MIRNPLLVVVVTIAAIIPTVITLMLLQAVNSVDERMDSLDAYIKAEAQEQPAKSKSLEFIAMTADGRTLYTTVLGRQVYNNEASNICEIVWTGHLRSSIATMGTILVNGKMQLDDFVMGTETGIIDAIKFELKGTTIASKQCIFDVLKIEAKQVNR